jgi:hypothetical protein
MPFIIEQQPRGTRVELDGRGLPFASSVEWGSEQRADVTYLPGSPDAVGQIFGPKQIPMSPEGRWGDRYMVGENPSCSVKVDGVLQTSAREAVRVLDRMCEEGLLLRVSYEDEIRYGLLLDFKYRPFAEGRTLERLDWSMRFEWLSKRNQALTPSIPARVGAQNLSARLAIFVQKLQDGAIKLLGKSDEAFAILQEPLTKIRSISNSATQAASALTQQAATAAGIATQLLGLTGELTNVAYEIANATVGTVCSVAAGLQAAAATTANIGQNQLDTAVGDVPPPAAPVILPPSGPGQLQEDAGLGTELVLASQQQTMLSICRQLQDLADQIQAAAQAALVDVEPYVVYVVTGETLRDIARRELGSSAAWRDVARVNGLAGSVVEPGTPLLIPRNRSLTSA